MKTTHNWHTSVKARGAVVGVATIGLALYGLLGGGAKSSVVPFSGKSVSTVASDKFSVATTDNSENFEAAAIGPGHSLYYYWQIAGTWYGPLGIGGAGTAYSGPGIDAEDDSTGNTDIAVEGPNHTLLVFWQIGSVWYGPLQIGAPGTTWSAPALTVDSLDHVNVTAQGPNGSLYFWWSHNATWFGPLQIAGPNTTFSAPSSDGDNQSGSGCPSGKSCIAVAAKGPANQALTYWSLGGQWTAPSTSGQNQEYASPAITNDGTHWWSTYQGPGNSLIAQQSNVNGGSNAYCVFGGQGTTYSAPTTSRYEQGTSSGSGGAAFNQAVIGPSQSLYVFWEDFSGPSNPATCGIYHSFYGPLQLSGAGTINSVPTLDTVTDSAGNGVTNLLVEGPSHTLWLFWSSAGSWNGPLQVGGPGSTFDSAN